MPRYRYKGRVIQMRKSKIIFLPSTLLFSILILMAHLFSVRLVYGSITQGERVSLTMREQISPVLEQPFFPLISQRSFSPQDDQTMEEPRVIAKRFRLRRHPDGGVIDPKGRREGELNQTADPQSDPEDIPGIEFDDQGRPRKKEPGQREEPLPRPGLQPPPPLPDPSGRLPILEEPIPPRE